MLTCYPQLLRSFVYKLPTLTEATSSFLGLANSIRWILARDLVIAEVCSYTSLLVIACSYLQCASYHLECSCKAFLVSAAWPCHAVQLLPVQLLMAA